MWRVMSVMCAPMGSVGTFPPAPSPVSSTCGVSTSGSGSGECKGSSFPKGA